MKINRFLFLLAIVSSLALQAKVNDGWTLSTIQRDNYAGISLANGTIGIVTSEQLFGTEAILLNGVYEHYDEFDGVSNAVFSPNFLDMALKLDGKVITDTDAKAWHQEMNMREAVVTTEFDLPKAHVKYTMQALRHLSYMGMMVVEITPKTNMTMEAINVIRPTEDNKDAKYSFQRIGRKDNAIPLNKITTSTIHNIHTVACTSSFLVDEPNMRKQITECEYEGIKGICLTHTLQAGKTFRFALVGAVCTSRDFFNPTNQASRMVTGITADGIDHPLARHKAQWERLWQSDIQIEGDIESQTDVRSCLYHLYSFVGEDNRESPSPMGLSSDGYNRHIFWDTEIWMYPPLLMLNQKMAKSCVDYRFDRLGPARQRAKMLGYRGVMFPWESDDSGEEACPLWALTGTFEHHITPDVAIACWNYYCVTKDSKWLRESGYPLMKEVAEFVCSRVENNSDGTYSINKVVGADEYTGVVDDNAFTNGAAQVSLKYAIEAARAVGEAPSDEWIEVEKNIKYHYFADGVMKEHATYDGRAIKQGDVVLLAYPLGLMTDKAEIRKNVDYYNKRMDPKGPAMGNSIVSILAAQLGNRDEAFALWKKSYVPHKCPPFGVLSEEAGGNNPYFATGAGGMLQAVLCGFGGLRITEDGIVQQTPCLPSKWKSLTITGVGPDKKTFTVTR
ncbi:MAG: glycoside hydrolase family 65 protein [Bacteroidales bacterium]|nr:glycoside hydrolase family 65 protein [Candidatus Sodaliphilus aphodohippi]